MLGGGAQPYFLFSESLKAVRSLLRCTAIFRASSNATPVTHTLVYSLPATRGALEFIDGFSQHRAGFHHGLRWDGPEAQRGVRDVPGSFAGNGVYDRREKMSVMGRQGNHRGAQRLAHET